MAFDIKFIKPLRNQQIPRAQRGSFFVLFCVGGRDVCFVLLGIEPRALCTLGKVVKEEF